jgi:hypothetical protein
MKRLALALSLLAMPAVAPCSRNAVATAATRAAMLTKPRMPPDGTNTSSTITPRPKKATF